MKRRCFRQCVVSFKRKGRQKSVKSPNQSSILNLFNQVLNCNFDFQINSIVSLLNSIIGPEVDRLFQIGPWFRIYAIRPSIDH